MGVRNVGSSYSLQAMGTDDKSHKSIRNEVAKTPFNSTLSSHQ